MQDDFNKLIYAQAMEIAGGDNMRIITLNPSNAYQLFSENNSENIKVERLNFTSLESYKDWVKIMKKSIYYQEEILGLSNKTIAHLLKLLEDSSEIYRFDGEADLYHYFWPNGEVKIVPCWAQNYTIQPNLFWLDKYPFLKLSHKAPNKCTEKFEIIKELFSYVKGNNNSEKNYLCATHNNHFGHFLLDNLPSISLLNGPLGVIGNSFCQPSILYKEGISELLHFCGTKFIESNNDELVASKRKGNFCQANTKLTELIPSSIFTHAFLWTMIGDRFRRKLISCNNKLNNIINHQPRRVFLKRSGKYESRISNEAEILECLKAFNFEIIDPSCLTAVDLAVALSNATAIFCESGSTTLNAIFFGNKYAKIFSLNPIRLFRETNDDMLFGGIPYLFAFCNRINFILGETVTKHAVQTSDICSYDVQLIANHLKNL